MFEQSASIDADPFEDAYWGAIDINVTKNSFTSGEVSKKVKPFAEEIADRLEIIKARPNDFPNEPLKPGQAIDISQIPEFSAISFVREYICSAGSDSKSKSQKMLESLLVTQTGLLAMETNYTIDTYPDSETGKYWVIRHEKQQGVGILLKDIYGLRVYGLREVRELVPLNALQIKEIKDRPLGTPKPDREVKTMYKFANLVLPLHSPCRIGVASEAPNWNGEFNPLNRRIERINSAAIYYPGDN